MEKQQDKTFLEHLSAHQPGRLVQTASAKTRENNLPLP